MSDRCSRCSISFVRVRGVEQPNPDPFVIFHGHLLSMDDRRLRTNRIFPTFAHVRTSAVASACVIVRTKHRRTCVKVEKEAAAAATPAQAATSQGMSGRFGIAGSIIPPLASWRTWYVCILPYRRTASTLTRRSAKSAFGRRQDAGLGRVMCFGHTSEPRRRVR